MEEHPVTYSISSLKKKKKSPLCSGARCGEKQLESVAESQKEPCQEAASCSLSLVSLFGFIICREESVSRKLLSAAASTNMQTGTHFCRHGQEVEL